MSKLFDKDISPACKYCATGKAVEDDGVIICYKKGMVSADYSCRHYKYDPIKRQPKRPPPLQEFTADDFKID